MLLLASASICVLCMLFLLCFRIPSVGALLYLGMFWAGVQVRWDDDCVHSLCQCGAVFWVGLVVSGLCLLRYFIFLALFVSVLDRCPICLWCVGCSWRWYALCDGALVLLSTCSCTTHVPLSREGFLYLFFSYSLCLRLVLHILSIGMPLAIVRKHAFGFLVWIPLCSFASFD